MVQSDQAHLLEKILTMRMGEESQERYNELIDLTVDLIDPHCHPEENVYFQQLGVSPCIICNHSPNSGGYATFEIKNEEGERVQCFVHHLFWLLDNIPRNNFLPDGDLIYSHRCMNPACCQPAHGEWVFSAVDVRRKRCRSAAYVVSNGFIHKLCPCDQPCLTIKVLGQDTKDAWVTGRQVHLESAGTYPVDDNGNIIENRTKDGKRIRKIITSLEKLNELYSFRPDKFEMLSNMCTYVVDEGSLLTRPGIDLGPCRISTLPFMPGTDRCGLRTRRVDGKSRKFCPWHIAWIKEFGTFPPSLEYDHCCHNGNCENPFHGGPNSFLDNQGRGMCANCSIVIDQNGEIHLICPHKNPCLVVKVLDGTTLVQAVQPVENT